jgi:2-polyprenyl-6-methoxyphenol hydroxylase-like FAD-dependent oxidoreductase
MAHPPVMIVGAGPVGLTLGCELQQRGVDVRLIERVDRPHPHAKAIILWPRGLEALARVGAAERVVAEGHVIEAQNYSSGPRRLARTRFDKLTGTRYPFALCLPQEQTEAALRQRFHDLGGKIEFGVRLEDFTQDGDGVQLTLSSQQGSWQERCSWLIGCDGAHSTVRDRLGVPFNGASYPQQFLLSDGPCETPLPHGEAHYFMTPKGVLVVVGLPGGLYRAFVSVAPDLPVEDAAAVVAEAAAERCPVPLRMVGEQRTGVFRVHRKNVERYRVGRVLLAGDAAHIHSPAGGQGLNTGIEDASSLAWRLAPVVAGTAPVSDLDVWERERLHVARGVVRDTDQQTRLWLLRGWKARARDVLLHGAQSAGLLDRVVVPRQAQLTLTYPGAHRRTGRLVTGGRLPDVPLGEGRWLHDLIQPSGATLLLFGGSGATVPPGPHTVRLDSPQVRSALHVGSNTAALIRPDAVVAWAGRATTAALGALPELH